MMVVSACPECDGTGFAVAETGATSAVRPCACSRRRRDERDLVAAGVPRRYVHCTFQNYRPVNATQNQAVAIARTFADDFPAVDRGLLFTGSCGTGKTHLSAAILRHLLFEQGVVAAFVDYQELLRRIQATYSRSAADDGASEERVLGPVLAAELLVLDDLGSRRSTPWAEETIAHVVTVRYNERRTTILTTNAVDMESRPDTEAHVPQGTVLLEDSVTERVLSRLHEMCRVVHLEGPDHRRVARA